jgi:hypothetical protein
MSSWDISKYPHTHEAPKNDAELVAHLHDIVESLGATAAETLLDNPHLLESTEQLVLEALQTIQLLKQNTPKMVPEEAKIDLQPTLRLLPGTSI